MTETASLTPTEVRHTIGASGSLALRNVSGRIRLSATDGDEAVVRVRSESGKEVRLNVERSEGSLLVEPERHGSGLFKLNISFGDGLEFDVDVPRGARLDVKSVSADIDATGLAGEQAYKTVSGDIRLARGGGRVNAMTVSGDVRLHEGGELELDAATTSGDLTVEAQLLRRLGVRTVSGDVRAVGRLEAGPRHAVETVSGDLRLETESGVSIDGSRALDFGRRDRGAVVFGDGAARLLFRSMSGDHHVKLIGGTGTPAQQPAPSTPPEPAMQPDRIEILRALERGEISVDEASRRLEGASRG